MVSHNIGGNFCVLFLSTIVNKIDKKGRVSVPAIFRAVLTAQKSPALVLYRSLKHPALDGSGIDRMKQLSDSIDQLGLFSDDQDDLVASIFADSHMLTPDSEGRVQMPEDLLAHAQIAEQVAFVGRGATFQIWNPDLFLVYQNQARDRLKTRGKDLNLALAAKDGGK